MTSKNFSLQWEHFGENVPSFIDFSGMLAEQSGQDILGMSVQIQRCGAMKNGLRVYLQFSPLSFPWFGLHDRLDELK